MPLFVSDKVSATAVTLNCHIKTGINVDKWGRMGIEHQFSSAVKQAAESTGGVYSILRQTTESSPRSSL